MAPSRRNQSEQEPQRLQRKIVLVGDGASGKTCLLRTYVDGQFPINSYIPTIFDTRVKDVEYNGKRIELALWDTAGQEDYDRLRIMSYPGAHIVLICFSVDSIESLENTHYKWLPEVKDYAPAAKVILVGLKTDLRTELETTEYMQQVYRRQPLQQSEGKQMADYLRVPYVECSAKQNFQVKYLFDRATSLSMEDNDVSQAPSETGCCVIL